MSGGASTRRIVVKLGGSVLTDEPAFARAASSLAELLAGDRKLDRLYIVVSAMKGVTDGTIDRLAPEAGARSRLRALLEGGAARPADAPWERSRIALSLLWGEIDAAHLLADTLDDIGVPAAVVTQLGLFPIAARGGRLSAEIDLDASRRRFSAFEQAVRDENVVILPGFGAVDGRGQPALLGRNASDYVAAVLSALDPKIGQVVFLKDVGGIFAGFRTAGERLIDEIDIGRLRAAGPQKVLDPRVLDVIACDFRVAGAPVGPGGTLVRLGRTA
jgi:aspartokinase